MEKNVAAGKTPSSLPMSTPPPVALAVSPKLSPVHTKSSLNSKPELGRSDMQYSFPEDIDVGPVSLRSMSNHSDVRHPGEDWNDRYSSGGTLQLLLSDIFIYLFVVCSLTVKIQTATAVTAGTLDAIRERMKSIQAAAAAGNLDSGSRPLSSMNGNIIHGLQAQLSHGLDPADAEVAVQSGVLPMDEKALSGLQARMERLKSGSLEPL